MHTKCSYREPFKLVLGITLYSPNLGQLNKNLPPTSTKTTAQASDKILYKNLLHSVETFKKSNDLADVPLVRDDGLVILAHKVILALAETPCFSSSRRVIKVQQRQSNAALQQQLDMIRLVALNTICIP